MSAQSTVSHCHSILLKLRRSFLTSKLTGRVASPLVVGAPSLLPFRLLGGFRPPRIPPPPVAPGDEQHLIPPIALTTPPPPHRIIRSERGRKDEKDEHLLTSRLSPRRFLFFFACLSLPSSRHHAVFHLPCESYSQRGESHPQRDVLSTESSKSHHAIIPESYSQRGVRQTSTPPSQLTNRPIFLPVVSFPSSTLFLASD